MTFLEQDQALLIDVLSADAPILRARVGCGYGEHERIVEQAEGFDLAFRDRQRQHHDIEGAARKLVEEDVGLGLAQFDAELRMAAMQER